MRKIIILALTASVALFAGKNVIPAPSEAVPVPAEVPEAPAVLNSNGLSLKIGTLGVGVDYEHFFNKKHALRFNPNYFKYTKNNKEIKGITYDAKLTLKSAGIIYDYHPWEGAFRLSLGAYYDGNKLDATAYKKSGQTVTFGNKTYEIQGSATIDATVDFKKFAPYVGIGWSSPEKTGWHLTADIGVMYVGSPKVSYTATGNYVDPITGNTVDITNDPTFKANIEKEKNEIYDKMKKYKWYPVLSIGITKKF